MHSGLDAVIIGGHPHICVLVHQAAGGVEEVVVLTDLRQAFCALALNKVVSTAIDVHEPVDHHLAIGIEMKSTRLDRITIRLCDPVIAVTNDFAVGCARIVEGAIDTDQSFANLHAVNIVVLRSITRANAVFGCIVVMNDDAIGIKAILVSRQRQVVILVHLIVAVFYRLTVFAKVVIVIMRLCLAANIDADQTGECNILAVGDPVGIRSLDAQTVFANLGKLCSICRIGSNGNDLLIPTGKHIAITRSFGFFGRAREGRCFPLLIHLSGLRTVNDPSDHSTGFGNDLTLFQEHTADIAVRIAGIAVFYERSIFGITDNRLVADCRDDFLRDDDLAADGAVLALRLTGLGAGGLDCGVNDHGVPLGGDFFQAGEDRTANRALRAGLMAGLGAGGRFFGDLNRRVAGRADGLCFCLIAARAGKRLDTGVFTSRSGRDHTIVPSVAKRGNDLAVCDLFVTILAVGVASIAGRGAGGILRAAKLLTLMRARLSAPCASDIVDGIAGLSLRSLKVGAVGVVQLCGCDGDLMCRHAALLRVLIRLGLRSGGTLLVVGAGTGAGADVRAAGGGIDAADGGQCTVDVHLYIR